MDLDLVEAIYAAAVEPGSWTQVLDGLSALVGADSAAIFFVDSERHFATLTVADCYSQEAIDGYAKNYIAKDVWLLSCYERAPGLVHLSEDLVRVDSFQRSDIYRGFYAPHNQLHGIGGNFLRRDSWNGFLALFRSPASRAFNAADKDRLQPLFKHLRRAFIISNELASKQNLADAVTAGADHLSMGMIFVDSKKNIVFANNKAWDIQRRGGFELKQGTFKTTKSQDGKKLNALMSDAIESLAGTGEGGGWLDLKREGKPSLHILVAPFLGSIQQQDLCGANIHCVVFLSDPDENIRPKIAAITSLYGLTAKQAHVCDGILQGKSLIEIAAGMGITRDGVRHHLRNVFTRTGVKRQSELIRLLTTSIPSVNNGS